MKNISILNEQTTFTLCEVLFYRKKKEKENNYHCREEIWSRSSPQKRGELKSELVYHRLHVNSSQGRVGNCYPLSNSLTKTETLILAGSFDYSCYFSSSPKFQHPLSRHVWTQKRATVTNLFFPFWAYSNLWNLAQKETHNPLKLQADYRTASPKGILNVIERGYGRFLWHKRRKRLRANLGGCWTLVIMAR